MKKMDLHIHTVSTKRDKPFAFSIEKLKGYVIQEKVDLIAITNHNLFDAQQFSDITNALPIKVFPGIEVDIEGGHLIVITDPSDIDDFTEKCAKVYRLNETSEDSYISEAQFMEIFNDLGKYILIPHYEKEPKLPLERVPQISPYIKCGEACSAKKFIYMQSRSEKLVPVLFSDWRVEEKAQFPLGRQTYIDIDDVNMMSLKYALTDKAKVSLKPEDGNSLFQILDNGLQISTGLTVLLGKRSSGKTYTLDQINAQFPGGKYIKQFSLLSTDDEQSQRKFEAALKNRGNSVTESYLGPFKTVVDDVQSVNLEQDAKEIDEYLETLKKAGEDAQRQDIFSKANLYQESNFSIKNLSSLVEMIEAVETLLGSIEYKELVEKYVGRRSLLRLAIALREQYIQEKTDSLHKEYVNSLITSVKKELSVRSSTTAVPDIDLYQILMNQHKVQVFHDVVKMIKNDSLIDDNSPAPSGGFGNPFNDPNWEQHITSFFGKREDVGIPGKDTTNHNGLDIAYPYGTPILAVEAGTVIKAGYHVSYGNYLVINHGGGYCTLYAHCSQLLAQVGDTVNKYDTIAKVGATGDVTGNHLHICVIIDGVYVNPKGYLH